jgi:hypothetical protein
MATLESGFDELYKLVSRYLGWGDTPTESQLKIVKELVYRGYRNFLYPISKDSDTEYCWSFLKSQLTIPIQSGKWKYALPENFSEMLTDPVYDDEDGYSALTRISPEQILDLRTGGIVSYVPSFYAIVTAPYDLEIGTKYEMWIHDEPSAAHNLRCFYKIDPLKPDGTNKLVGGVKAAEAIIESCLAMAETQEDGEFGVHSKMASGYIQSLIKADSKIEGDSYLGNLLTGNMGTIINRGDNAKFKLDNLYPGEHTYSE